MVEKQPGGIRLVAVRVQNFRSLRLVEVPLEGLTVLIGKNNSGKTSFLEALFFAIGAGLRSFSEDDVYLAPGESALPRDRRVTVEILIRPTGGEGQLADKFPAGSPWLNLWGEGVTQDDEDNDLVVIRAQAKWDSVRSDYEVSRGFLRDWPAAFDDAHFMSSKVVIRPVANNQLEPLALYLLDAKRDIVADLRNRSSFWSKLVSDPGLPDEDVKEIEDTLTDVNRKIVDASKVLTHLQAHLSSLSESPGAADELVIAPVSRHLRDLTKGMDVLLSGKDAATFSLARQGMGTRSVATLFTFRAYAEWRQTQAKGSAVHPLLAVEEPETHLHPQAQRALLRQLEKPPGQCIVSTHSPYICSQANVLQFRVFWREGGCTEVRRLAAGLLNEEDLRKVHRQVLNTRGDVLFATAVILVSGETEEQALPVFADAYWRRTWHENGLSIVGVGGDGAYLPFIRLAEAFGIPWFIFSDGEVKAIKDLESALSAAGLESVRANDRVSVITGGRDFETYMVDEAEETLVEMYVSTVAKNEKHREALEVEWERKTDRREALIKRLQSGKTRFGRRIAEAMVAQPDPGKRFPGLIRDLFVRIASTVKLS